MKVYLATDHAGYELKEKIKHFLQGNGYDLEDCGAYIYDQQDDYPDFVSKVGKAISQISKDRGIIFGGSGQGEAIVANKFLGVRAIVFNCDNLEIIKLGIEHNNANVLSIGARFVNQDSTINAVSLFLKSKFFGEERHRRRIEKISRIENSMLGKEPEYETSYSK